VFNPSLSDHKAAMRSIKVVFASSLLFACAAGASTKAAAPIVVPEQPASSTEDSPAFAPAEPVTTTTTTTTTAEADSKKDLPAVLPVSWANTFGHNKPFAEAIKTARTSRTSFETVAKTVTTSGDGGLPTPKEFERVSSLLDQGSRQFAAAYHAPDATPTARIDTLREAASMILAWSRQLDEAGLARAPAQYRSDPSVALTFEDVANGPAKRWREEGLALVTLCVESARTSNIDTAAARECGGLRKSYERVLAERRSSKTSAAAGKDAGAPTGCACDPGDPLCSASMSGWCRPK
jgi:hypothetical protein